MIQLTRDLDVENIVSRREYNRIRRWLNDGIPDPKVTELYNSAKEKFKIEWEYLKAETCFQIYIDGKKIYNPEKFEDINGAINAVKEKVKPSPFLRVPPNSGKMASI